MYIVKQTVFDRQGNLYNKGSKLPIERFTQSHIQRLLKAGHIEREIWRNPTSDNRSVDVTVMITTYKRPDCLYALTKQLKTLRPDVRIIVIDDFSNESIDTEFIDVLLINEVNNGRRRYWETVNRLWDIAIKYPSKYYISLVDDLMPKKNFFDCIGMFERISDSKKIAMHLANNGRVKNWTNFNRRDYNNEVYLTQTTEQSFICLPEFITYRIPKISPRRWEKNPLAGSGVGSSMNNYWVNQNRTIFGVKKSLIRRNNKCSESLMNPEERKINKWKVL